MMEELHDVQLTEIKPLLTGQVGQQLWTRLLCSSCLHPSLKHLSDEELVSLLERQEPAGL